MVFLQRRRYHRFFYSEEDIPEMIHNSLAQVSRVWLQDNSVKGDPDGIHKNHNLPFGLCKIDANGQNEWVMSRFHSPYIAGQSYSWVKIKTQLDRGSFLNLLNHPLEGCLLGWWYERWVLK
jgi:hypothetical protein